jgi:hypothetical protein
MFDQEVSRQQIQSLNDADAIVAFFAYLGYDTNSRLQQTPANLGITSETVQRQIKRIERIADKQGLLSVYLVEMTSVTVAGIQGILRPLRNRAGQYLFVLTSDYESIDFVLLQRVTPEGEGKGITQKQVGIRPRILTVYRRNPDAVALRVIRRFSYTEMDPFAQFDKLVSAFGVAEWSEPLFNNRALFSDYYLKSRLPEDPAWKDDPKPSYQRFVSLYAEAPRRWGGKSIKEVAEGLLEPAFALLGFSYRGNNRNPEGSPNPHYHLYHPEINNGESLAVCLTYPWGRYLDGKDEARDKDKPNENPGQIVVSLLEKGEAPWAIVTNGKHWRLYSAKAHSRATNYYEIDLEETLSAPDPSEIFRYFWLLFRREAFEIKEVCKEGEKVKASFLDILFDGSETYAKELGERLKERIFEEIFPHFAHGFIEDIFRNDKKFELDQEALDRIFQGTLTFLYRLLFLLYAEARDLFPVKEVRGYWEKSLTKLKEEVAHAARNILDEAPEYLKKAYDKNSTILFDRLAELFRIIDHGDHALNVPLYNGGLFITDADPEDLSPEAQNARFLLQHKIPDQFLALGLDLMARDLDVKTQSLAFIDYKSLGVRQLGSIYEGLLEFKLRIAPEKMAVVRGKRTEEVIPYRDAQKEGRKILTKGRGKEAEERVYPKGAIYLENDRRERKATGSYYTPDHIVKYIVEHAVGPVLKEKFETVTPKLREAQKAYHEAVKAWPAFKMAPGKNPELVAQRFRSVVDELFTIRVLDPAMGSGHFLVEAVDFIIDHMLDFLNAFPWNPVQTELKRTRETILEEMDRQGVTIDPGRLTDVALMKRHVLKRCIYGVDLNPMAVELAKVSLWLDCFTLGAPLSFLDHHLRCGNSLIGVTVAEVHEAVEPEVKIIAKEKRAASATEWKEIEIRASQLTLFGSRFAGLLLATDLMRHIGELSDVTSAQVQQSRAEYRKASDALAPFKRILDVYTSQWFGNDGKTRKAHRAQSEPKAIAFLKSPKAELFINARDEKSLKSALNALPSEMGSIAETALNAAAEKRFFHWELEFPEVFYGPRPGTSQAIERLEGAGFDAVIGNPPYIGFHGFENLKNFLKKNFHSCQGKFDIYIPFWELALNLTRDNGLGSFINPSGFMKRDHGKNLRELLTKYTIERIHDFLHECIFKDVVNYVCIPMLRKSTPAFDHLIHVTTGKNFDMDGGLVPQKELKKEPWILIGKQKNIQFSLTEGVSISPLSEIAQVIAEGIVTGKNEVFLINAHSNLGKALNSENITRPALRGESVDRYNFSWDGTLLIYPYFESDGRAIPLSDSYLRKNAPLTYEYLCESRGQLKGRSWFDRSSKKWFELWNQRDIKHQSGMKLIIQENSVRCELNLDEGHFFYLDTCCGISLHKDSDLSYGYLLALLNSKFLDMVFREITVPKAQGHFIHKPMFLKKLPIRLIKFGTPQEERIKLVASLTALYAKNRYNDLIQRAKHLVPKKGFGDLSGTPLVKVDRTDVIHDFLDLLANEMIGLNKNMKKETARFLGWLAQATGLEADFNNLYALEALRGKSILKGFFGDYQKCEKHVPFEKLWEIMEKNRDSLPNINGSLKNQIQIKYEQCLEMILPVKDRLHKTDWLIDQLVYLLYGLHDKAGILEEKEKTFNA